MYIELKHRPVMTLPSFSVHFAARIFMIFPNYIKALLVVQKNPVTYMYIFTGAFLF